MYKVSVIVPVYNTEKYLKRCLDSLMGQTLDQMEIICINDGSTDLSTTILDDYSTKFPQIKIITHKTNRGISNARNTGLKYAQGEYLGFVDSDDAVDPDFFEKLYTKAVKEKADMAKGEVSIIDYRGKERHSPLNKLISQNKSKLYFAYYWWSAVYRNKFIQENNIHFKRTSPMGEDILFLNQAILKANKLVLVNDSYYHYYRMENSRDSKVLPLNKIKSILKIRDQILKNVLVPQVFQVDPKGVNYICSWCIEHALNMPFQTNRLEGLEECLRAALKFYKKSKKFLIRNETTIFPVIMEFLDNYDYAGLKDFYIKNDTPQKIAIAHFHYLKLNGNKNAIRK